MQITAPVTTTKRKSTLKAAYQFEIKSKQAALAQSKLEQAKRRQVRSSSVISTDLDRWNKSDTVEVINLVFDSPQKSPITIVTSSSPKDFMVQKSLGRKSIDKIVQKLHVHQELPVQASQQPIQSNQPAREPTTVTIPDSPATVAITIESDEDHDPIAEDPLIESQSNPQAETQREFTRIGEDAPNIPIEHALSDEKETPKSRTNRRTARYRRTVQQRRRSHQGRPGNKTPYHPSAPRTLNS